MKMTYTELSVIGRLRKISMCGPFSMFCKLIHLWKDSLSPVEVGFLLFLSFGQMFLVMMNCQLVHIKFIFFLLLAFLIAFVASLHIHKLLHSYLMSPIWVWYFYVSVTFMCTQLLNEQLETGKLCLEKVGNFQLLKILSNGNLVYYREQMLKIK